MSLKYKKLELTTPGIYQDELLSNSYHKPRRISLKQNIQLSQLEDYDTKVIHAFEKQQNQSNILYSKIKPAQNLTKKELIEKLVLQMKQHLSKKEKDLFENPSEDDSTLQKRKSLFYQGKTNLIILEQMKERFAYQQELQKKKKEEITKSNLKYQSLSQESPQHKLQRKTTSLEISLYEQEQIQNGIQEYYKLEQLKKRIEKQLNKLGLTDSSQQTLHSSQIILPKYSVQVPQKSRSNPKSNHSNKTKNIMNKIKERIQHVHTIQSVPSNGSINTLLTNCDQEIASLKQMDNDITKRKRVQFRKFKIIQSDLDAIAYMRFQKK